MPSPSPKRSSSKSKKPDSDDLLLAARIDDFKIEYPKQMLIAVGLVTAFLPAFLAHGFLGLNWTHLLNIPFFLAAIGATGFLLSQAYGVTFETEFLKRQRHYAETKTDHDAKVLRQLRLQVALGYAIFSVNLLFVVIGTVLQAYILRQFDARVGLLAAPTLTAFALRVLAQKNEEARKRKIGRQ